MLELVDLTRRYGDLVAVDDLSLRVPPGVLFGLLGPNGAGKSTVLKTVMGMLQPTRGEVRFDGEPIVGLRPDLIVRRGIAYVPQGRIVFKGMSVVENLEMGAYLRKDRGSASSKAEDLDRVLGLFPRLKERFGQSGGSMSGGEQQMLAIGRALMARPRLLLLDEPSMGLAPMLIRQIFAIISEINAQGTTVLLVEQNAAQALRRAHRAYVLETGLIVREGTGAGLADDPAVRAAYLGAVT